MCIIDRRSQNINYKVDWPPTFCRLVQRFLTRRWMWIEKWTLLDIENQIDTCSIDTKMRTRCRVFSRSRSIVDSSFEKIKFASELRSKGCHDKYCPGEMLAVVGGQTIAFHRTLFKSNSVERPYQQRRLMNLIIPNVDA